MTAEREVSRAPRSAPKLLPELERAILALLDRRAADASICPSEAARAAYDGDGDGWRASMGAVRAAARRLADDGQVEITQGGAVVDHHRIRGPIRIRRPRNAADLGPHRRPSPATEPSSERAAGS